MILEDLEALLTAPGRSIALQHLVNSPDELVLIRLGAAGGPLPGASRSASIQIRARGVPRTDDARVSVVGPWDESQAIYEILSNLDHEPTASGGQIITCFALQDHPEEIGPDENGRHEWSQNYVIHFI